MIRCSVRKPQRVGTTVQHEQRLDCEMRSYSNLNAFILAASWHNVIAYLSWRVKEQRNGCYSTQRSTGCLKNYIQTSKSNLRLLYVRLIVSLEEFISTLFKIRFLSPRKHTVSIFQKICNMYDNNSCRIEIEKETSYCSFLSREPM
jgi:hypothetical protein